MGYLQSPFVVPEICAGPARPSDVGSLEMWLLDTSVRPFDPARVAAASASIIVAAALTAVAVVSHRLTAALRAMDVAVFKDLGGNEASGALFAGHVSGTPVRSVPARLRRCLCTVAGSRSSGSGGNHQHR